MSLGRVNLFEKIATPSSLVMGGAMCSSSMMASPTKLRPCRALPCLMSSIPVSYLTMESDLNSRSRNKRSPHSALLLLMSSLHTLSQCLSYAASEAALLP